ncbi:hypothetical protein TOK_1027 [Pseudonocardia sp. N23]|nr:hypothetical protein TOK_1027 [Pseudonocardia sp. N23]
MVGVVLAGKLCTSNIVNVVAHDHERFLSPGQRVHARAVIPVR